MINYNSDAFAKTGKKKLFKPQHHLVVMVIPIEKSILNYGIEIPEDYVLVGNEVINKYNNVEKDVVIALLLNDKSILAEEYVKKDDNSLVYPYPGISTTVRM